MVKGALRDSVDFDHLPNSGDRLPNGFQRQHQCILVLHTSTWC